SVAVKGHEAVVTIRLPEGIGVAVIPGNDKGASDGAAASAAEAPRDPVKRECAGGRIDLKGLQAIAGVIRRSLLDVHLGASAVDRAPKGSATLPGWVERRVDLRHLPPDPTGGSDRVRMDEVGAHRDEMASGGADHQAYGVLEGRA